MNPPRRNGTRPNPPLGATYPIPWPAGYLDMGADTDIGPRRENQDAVYLDPLWGVVAVADGMGGQGPASTYAAEASVGRVRSVLSTGRHSPGDARDLYRSSASYVRANLARMQQEGGTALSILDLAPDRASLAWGGDVAVIWVPERGTGQRLTMPHNLAGKELQRGNITEDQYRVHSHANVVTNGIWNTSAPAPELRLGPPPKQGDRYVVCTDGLFDALGTDRIAGILRSAPVQVRAQDLASTLLEEARRGGLGDNATVAVVSVLRLPAQRVLGIRAR